MKKFIAIAVGIAVFGIFFAQKTSALTINPPRIEVSADPGQRIEEVIKIFNDTSAEMTIYASTINFTSKEGEEGVPKFLSAKESENELASWIDVNKDPIVLSPLEKKNISFAINIPDYAEPGGHYAAVFFGSKPPEIEEGKNIGISGKIGSLILLRVSGDIKEEGMLKEFYLKSNKKIFECLPVSFIVGFENLGNVHMQPQGEITIKNIFGQNSSTININEEGVGGRANVLPNTLRHFEVSWVKNALEKEPRGFMEELKAEKENFAMGRYKADLNLIYGINNESVQASVVFWVFPWRLMLVYAIAIIILLAFIILAIKKYNRWIIKKAEAGKAEKIDS